MSPELAGDHAHVGP